MEYDVVVVGSGAGGLAAAVTAAKHGSSVLVLEATPMFGGTTALSFGGTWIPCNHYMKDFNVTDSVEEAEVYLRAALGSLYDAPKVQAYVRTAEEMVQWFEANTEVKMCGVNGPDYVPGLPGWKTGRGLLTQEYDGRKLGPWLAKLRRPIREFGLFRSMQIGFADAFMMRQWNKSFAAFLYSAKKISQHAVNRLINGRGTRLANGNALIAMLMRSALDTNVELRENSRVMRLAVEDGEVTGVFVKKPGGEQFVRARRAVVLATGGFGANPAMRRKYIPLADAGFNLQPEGNVGDGINMGIAAGASFSNQNASNGIWAPVSVYRRPDGTLAKFPSLVFDRHCPGSILVDAATAKRFVNESFHYQHFGVTAQKKNVTKIWMISDRPAVRAYGMGLAKPAPFPLKPWVKKGYIIEAGTIEDLARKIELDPATLKETVETFNGYADRGKDAEFQRGDDPYSAAMGDPAHKPNPTLGAIRAAPFYALELHPGDLCTFVGLDTNALGQVVRADGAPIRGLYASGLDNNVAFRGVYAGGGSAIGHAMIFGYIAARHIAGASKAAASRAPALSSVG